MKKIVLYMLGLLLFGTCHPPEKKAVARQLKTENSETPDTVQQASLSRNEVVQAYTTAIAEYLKAAFRNQPGPDTLFIGKHEEFPDAGFPSTILLSSIHLVEPEEAYKWHERKNYVYLNVIGRFNHQDAEFIVVRFNQGTKPQHNCILDLVQGRKQRI